MDDADNDGKHGIEEEDNGSDDIATLQLCMNQCDIFNMLKHYLDVQVKLLKQEEQGGMPMIIGSVMLGIQAYVNRGIKGLLEYVRDSHEQKKPLLAHNFAAWLKPYTLDDLTEKSGYKDKFIKPKCMLNAVYKSKFWYFAFLNIAKKKKQIKTWDDLKIMLHKIWDHEKTRKYKVVNRFVPSKDGMGNWYDFKAFYTDDFETECWKPICKYWMEYTYSDYKIF